MALNGSPTFFNKEILTYQKLNNWSNSIDNKFQGNIQAADISWPLVAQGNLDMNGNSIIGLSSVFNIFAVTEGFTFIQAVAAVNAAGGGAIYIPTGTTVSVADIDFTTGDVYIYGGGPDSVLQVGAATDYGISFSSGSDNVRISNLTLSGNSVTAHCVQFTALDNVQLDNISVTAVGSAHAAFNFVSSGDTPCSRIKCTSCDFNGGYGGLLLDGVDKLQVVGCDFSANKADSILYSDSTAARPFRDVSIVACSFENNDTSCIELTNGAAAGVTRTNVVISGCTFRGDSSGENTIRVTKFQNLTISDNAIYLPGAVAIDVNQCSYFTLSGNTVFGGGATGEHGIDLDASCTYGTVSGNHVSFMTGGVAVGISCQGEDCTVTGNVCNDNVIGFSTNMTRGAVVGNSGYNNGTNFGIIAGEQGHNQGDT